MVFQQNQHATTCLTALMPSLRNLLQVIPEQRKFGLKAASGNVLIRADEVPAKFWQSVADVCLTIRIEQQDLVFQSGRWHFRLPNDETPIGIAMEFVDHRGDRARGKSANPPSALARAEQASQVPRRGDGKGPVSRFRLAVPASTKYLARKVQKPRVS